MARKTWSDISSYMIKEQSGFETERGLGKVFLGRIVLSIPYGGSPDAVETNREAFEPYSTNYWPGLASAVAGDPVIDEYTMERDHPGRPGYSRITLIYRKPKLLSSLDTHLKAIFYVDLMGKARTVTYVGEQTIEGPEQFPANADDYITEWHVVRGSNQVLEPNCSIKLTIAYSTVPFDTIYETEGKYSNTGIVFGTTSTLTVPAKKLLYLGATVSTDTNRHGLWLVNHFFETSQTAYDVKVLSHAYIKRALQVALRTLGGDGFAILPAQKGRIQVLEPTGDNVEVDIHRGGADMTDLLDGVTFLN